MLLVQGHKVVYIHIYMYLLEVKNASQKWAIRENRCQRLDIFDVKILLFKKILGDIVITNLPI